MGWLLTYHKKNWKCHQQNVCMLICMYRCTQRNYCWNLNRNIVCLTTLGEAVTRSPVCLLNLLSICWLLMGSLKTAALPSYGSLSLNCNWTRQPFKRRTPSNGGMWSLTHGHPSYLGLFVIQRKGVCNSRHAGTFPYVSPLESLSFRTRTTTGQVRGWERMTFWVLLGPR